MTDAHTAIAPLVSVVLPTYNEAPNIARLVEALLEYIPWPTEIVVVDDDSPDRTWHLVNECAARDARVRLIHRVGRRGLTSAIQEGIDASNGEIVVWMDCDFSMPPALVPKLVEQVLAGYDAVVGSRFLPGGSGKQCTEGTPDSWLAAASSAMLNHFLRCWLGPHLTDYTSGFIACRRKVLREVRLQGDYGEYFIDLMFRIRRWGYQIIELPYVCVPRARGESKTGRTMLQVSRRGLKYVGTALRLRLSAQGQRG